MRVRCLLGVMSAICATIAPIHAIELPFMDAQPDFLSSTYSAVENGAKSVNGKMTGSRLVRRRTTCESCDKPWDRDSVYVSFGAGGSWLDGDAGGFNTVGAFSNEGFDDKDNDYALSVAIGHRIPIFLLERKAALRFELAGTDYHDYNLVTGSFPGQPGPPTFFYQVNVGDMWSTSANLWLDIPVADRVELYTGFGLGAAGHQLTVDDTVVSGSKSDTDFMAMFGMGFNVHVTDRMTVDLGWRLQDLGTANVPLEDGGGGPAGNYVLDLQNNLLMATVRVDLW